MSNFYDKFPTIRYNFDGNRNKNTSVFTNVMFRFIISDKIKNNMFAYYDIVVPDGETISTVADKYYGDPEFHWVIAMLNNIVDPMFDWPMDYRIFQRYIKEKYGSLAYAQTTTRHYTRTITRKINSKIVETSVYEIGTDEYASTPAYTLNTFNLQNNEVLEEVVTTGTVSYYDYESEINENKRNIKLIKKEYLKVVTGEFNNLVANKNPTVSSIYKRLT